LVERGVITGAQLKEALESQMNEGGLIGEIIVKLGFAKEEDIAYCLSLQYGFPFLPLEHYDIPQDVVKMVPVNVASHYSLIPIDKMGNTLTVVMANPLNVEAIEDLEDITSLEIRVFVGTSTEIRNAIKRHYSENG